MAILPGSRDVRAGPLEEIQYPTNNPLLQWRRRGLAVHVPQQPRACLFFDAFFAFIARDAFVAELAIADALFVGFASTMAVEVRDGLEHITPQSLPCLGNSCHLRFLIGLAVVATPPRAGCGCGGVRRVESQDFGFHLVGIDDAPGLGIGVVFHFMATRSPRRRPRES